MAIYLGALFLSFCFSLLYKQSTNEDEKAVTIHNGKVIFETKILVGFLSFLPLTFLSSVRYDVGTDWRGTYLQIFTQIKNGLSIRDVGYGLLNKFVLLFTDNYAGIIFLTAVLIGIFTYLAIFQQSDIPSVSILLLVFTCQYFFSMNGVRQALATSIFLYAMKYIIKQDYKRYFFWIMVATSIHSMALLYIIPYFYKLIARFYKQIIGALLISFLFADRIARIIRYVFVKNSFLLTFFAWYFVSSYNDGKMNIMSLAVQMSVLLFMIIIYRKNRNDEKSQLFITLQIVCVAALLLSGVLPLMQRVSFLFSFANIIYLPYYIKMIKNRKVKFGVMLLILSGFFAYMWVTIAIRNYHEVLPYQSIFGKGAWL